MKPFNESAHSHTLIPLFTGFKGMCCLRESLPLKGIIASSIETFFDGLYLLLIASTTESRRGHTLNNLSWFACPRGNSLLLLFRYCDILAKRFLRKIFCTFGTPRSWFLDQYEYTLGNCLIPNRIFSAKNAFTSSVSVSRQAGSGFVSITCRT